MGSIFDLGVCKGVQFLFWGTLRGTILFWGMQRGTILFWGTQVPKVLEPLR